MSTPISKLVRSLGARSAVATKNEVFIVSAKGDQKLAPDGDWAFPNGTVFSTKGGRIVSVEDVAKPVGWRRGPVSDSDWFESWHEDASGGGTWNEAEWSEGDDGGGGWSWDEWDEVAPEERRDVFKLLDRRVPDAAALLIKVSKDFQTFRKTRPVQLDALKKI